jgi:predicted dehydrogenase
MTMKPIKFLVAGAGHLGRFHAQKIIANPKSELVGIYDSVPVRAEALAAEVGSTALASMDACSADAAIIATTTSSHAEVACRAIALGMHVLVEKPIAPSLEQARKIIAAAKANGRILAVGHTERFNPAVSAAMALVSKPRYITSERLSPFSGRSLDVDVILDLMIHDLDILAALVKAPLKEARAIGVPVLTNSVDMASARLEFADGTVAELQAGRVSMEPCRKIRFFTEQHYVSVDCAKREVKAVKLIPPVDGQEMGAVRGEPVIIPDWDPLAQQLENFIHCIQTQDSPLVSGDDGLRALELACAVREVMTNPAT